jgi:hypothetical protein
MYASKSAHKVTVMLLGVVIKYRSCLKRAEIVLPWISESIFSYSTAENAV